MSVEEVLAAKGLVSQQLAPKVALSDVTKGGDVSDA